MLGYGSARILVELFREPDAHIGLLPLGTTWGQWLSVPVILFGVYLFLRRPPRRRPATGDADRP